MKKVIVILNEQHRLLPDQERVLNGEFRFGFEILPVPAQGWTLEEIKNVLDELIVEDRAVVFASPIPALLLLLASNRGGDRVWILHNDKRVAKEVPDGKGGVKLIHTVAPDGWELV